MRPAFMMTHSDLVLSQKHVTCNCAFRHNYHQTLSSFPLHSSRSHNEPSTTLEKRIKQYFFKLLFAARNRDERLLKVVLRSLADDEDFQRERPRLYSKNLRELNDVLLKASSRCGQIALADRVFKVRFRVVPVTDHAPTGKCHLPFFRLSHDSHRIIEHGRLTALYQRFGKGWTATL